MADVFISYSSQNRDVASMLATALEREHLSVWWDHDIVPGDRWSMTIQRALDASHVAVCLWSRVALESEWVLTEAAEGKRRDILVPVLIEALEPTEIPLEFRRRHYADLSGWDGDEGDRQYVRVLAAIRAKLSAAKAPAADADRGEAATAPRSTSPVRDEVPTAPSLRHATPLVKRLVLATGLGGAIGVGLIFALQEITGHEWLLAWSGLMLMMSALGAMLSVAAGRSGRRACVVFGAVAALVYLALAVLSQLPGLIVLLVFPLFVAPAWMVLLFTRPSRVRPGRSLN